ncbi:MAG: MBL fold metallo-hydrolase, partial [Eubacterium sp.]|nr:MBL fold metallo-hydrolase [Eubacterium sp.]
MKWKLTTLIENHGDKEGKLACEHGLSVLIEGENIRLLMDTGQSGSFYENAAGMGISLSGLDAVLLSHAHYDHTGGLLRLIKEEGIPKKVYVGKHFFRKCYDQKADGRMKYIGTKFDSQMLRDLRVPVEEMDRDILEVVPGLTLYRNFEQKTPYEEYNPCFFYQEEEPSCSPYGRCVDSMTYHQDIFEDEIAVALNVEGGLFVIVGCSHPGIVNILTTISARS